MRTVIWGFCVLAALAGAAKAEEPVSQDMLKRNLGLSGEQAGKFAAAVDAREKAMKPYHDQMDAGLKKLSGQVQKKAADAEVGATLTELKTAREAMQSIQTKFQAEVDGFLTPTQRAKMILKLMAPRPDAGAPPKKQAARKSDDE